MPSSASTSRASSPTSAAAVAPRLHRPHRGNGIKLTTCNAAYWRGGSNHGAQRIWRRFPEGRAGRLPPKREGGRSSATTTSSARLEYFHHRQTASVRGLGAAAPKGARVVQVLQRWVGYRARSAAIFSPRPPLMASATFTRSPATGITISTALFILGDPYDETKVFALRPMTCPFQYQVYLNRQRSLPRPADAPGRDLDAVRQVPARCTASSACVSSRSRRPPRPAPDQLEEFKGDLCQVLPRHRQRFLTNARSASPSGIPRANNHCEARREQWDHAPERDGAHPQGSRRRLHRRHPTRPHSYGPARHPV